MHASCESICKRDHRVFFMYTPPPAYFHARLCSLVPLKPSRRPVRFYIFILLQFITNKILHDFQMLKRKNQVSTAQIPECCDLCQICLCVKTAASRPSVGAESGGPGLLLLQGFPPHYFQFLHSNNRFQTSPRNRFPTVKLQRIFQQSLILQSGM